MGISHGGGGGRSKLGKKKTTMETFVFLYMSVFKSLVITTCSSVTLFAEESEQISSIFLSRGFRTLPGDMRLSLHYHADDGAIGYLSNKLCLSNLPEQK